MAQPRRCVLSQEVELKLVLCASDAEVFTGLTLMAAGPVARKLHALYFDTPDHALLNAGLSLRIRRSGRKRIQTIKGANTQGTGLFSRSEWEMTVPDDRPVLGCGTPVPDLLGEAVDTIAPAFEVKVERMTWLIEDETAAIEVVLDRGAAIAADRQSPVCEIELELKRGTPEAIFTLARKIADRVPVRLGVVTKAERGYGLLGPTRTAFKAEKLRLDEAASSAKAFQAIAGPCIRHYRLNETRLLDAREPEALHQARVALRRLRSAIAIFEPVVAGGGAARFQSELRWLTTLLGEARDLDVLLEKTAPGTLQDRLQEAREKAYAALETTLHSQRVRVLFLDLTQWLATGDWLHASETLELRQAPVRGFAKDALRRLRRRVKKRGAAMATLSDEHRHDARKAAKRLRYGAEFFGSLFAGEKPARRYRKFTADLEQLQDELGALNDLAAAPLLLEHLGLSQQAGAGHLLAHRKKSRIISASQEAFSDLMDRKSFWS